jgi:hypothetical protein
MNKRKCTEAKTQIKRITLIRLFMDSSGVIMEKSFQISAPTYVKQFFTGDQMTLNGLMILWTVFC